MSSPESSLSLDEFPSLLDVPMQWEAVLGKAVVDALRQALNSEPYAAPEPNLWPNQNQTFVGYLSYKFHQLQNSFIESGEDQVALAFLDLTFALIPWHMNALRVVEDWFEQTQSEEYIGRVLYTISGLHHLPSLYTTCLKRASYICNQAGFRQIARALFFAWQDLPIPTYPELEWLPLPFPVKGARAQISPGPSPLYVLTTPPEVTEEAIDGWRDGRWNPISPQQNELLNSLVERYKVQPWAEAISNTAQNCIRFEQTPYKRQWMGRSHLGGLPDVPKDWIWPQDLEFLAQFDLQEIAPFDVNHALPPSGLLRFFADNEMCGYRVEWDQTLLEQLGPALCPANYDVNGLDDANGSNLTVYSPTYITPCRIISVESTPIYGHYEAANLLNQGDFSDYVDEIRREFLPTYGNGWDHQLLGSYDDGQKEAYNSQQFHGVSGNQAEIRKGADEWTLLFQIDSNDDMGTMFSDAGTVYFMIRREDLAARRFDRIFVTMTCG